MQLKSLSVIVGACALLTTAVPFAVHAQTHSSSPTVIAQARKQGPWASLGLTDDQKTKIRQIEQNARAQMEEVFTPDQKAKLEAARQERQAQRQQGQRPQVGQGRRGKFADLNLTDEQKQKIRQIRQSTQQQILAILSPEQRTKLEELKATRRQRWQERHNNQSTPENR